MSEIRIRGLRMPTSCWDCPVQINSICVSQGLQDFSSREHRPERCPLVSIPSHNKVITIPEDIKPVVHGEWITPPPESDEQPYCSRCHWHAYGDLYTPYCPGCGAKMDGVAYV